MRRIAAFLFVGIAYTATSLFGEETKMTWEQRSLTLEVPELTEVVSGTITGVNHTGETIELVNAKASCGCLILTDNIQQKIVPSGKATISFQLHISSGEDILHKQILVNYKYKGATFTDNLSLVVHIPEVVRFSEHRVQIYPGLQQYKINLYIKGDHVLRNVEVNCGRGNPVTGSFSRMNDKQGLIAFAVPENIGHGSSIVCTVRVVLDDWRDLVDYVVFDR